jgi:hypothetical protein
LTNAARRREYIAFEEEPLAGQRTPQNVEEAIDPVDFVFDIRGHRPVIGSGCAA